MAPQINLLYQDGTVGQNGVKLLFFSCVYSHKGNSKSELKIFTHSGCFYLAFYQREYHDFLTKMLQAQRAQIFHLTAVRIQSMLRQQE